MQNAIWCFTDLEARWDHYDNLLWVIQQICITPEFDSSPFASRYLATIELIRNRSYRDHWAFTCLSLQSTLQTLSIQPEWLYLLIHTNCNQSCSLLAAGTLVHRKGGEKKDDCPKPMRMRERILTGVTPRMWPKYQRQRPSPVKNKAIHLNKVMFWTWHTSSVVCIDSQWYSCNTWVFLHGLPLKY